MNNQNICAFVDNGSDVSLIKLSTTKRFPEIKYDKPGIQLLAFGGEKKVTLGSFVMNVCIDSKIYSVRFQVVPDEWISDEAILGKNFLQNVTVLIESGKVKIVSSENTSYSEIQGNNIYAIEVENLLSDEFEDDLHEIINPVVQNSVHNLIVNYNPKTIEKSCIDMKICLTDENPIYQKARRLAPKEREAVNKQIEEWLEQKIIRHSKSDFTSPIVIVKKKDGSDRLCVDYRKVNQKIVKDRYPLPVMDEVLEKLYDAKIFTTLDLKNGFFHVDIEESSRKYTSFITPDGQYEFLKAPFGLCNSPAVFQRYINTVFQDLIRQGYVIVYMDDAIIPGSDELDNLQKLEKVIKVAEEHGLIIKWKKCRFMRTTISFLGHVISCGSIRPSDEKIKAVKNFPQPNSIKQLQSFLGLTGFFRKFVANYSKLARPLTDLLKKDQAFIFEMEQVEAFILLKESLCKEPVLKLFSPSLETQLHTDASLHGFGGVLFQKHENQYHPVFYLSFKSNAAEKNYTSYELEVLAIVRCLKKLRIYLLGLNFTIFTDCQAFQATMKKKDLCARVARWAIVIQEFNCEVIHRPGKNMLHVDALSRFPVIMRVENGLLCRIKKAQEKDEYCNLIFNVLKRESYNSFEVRNGVLYKFCDGNYLLVVPKLLEREVIKIAHEKGHMNSRTTENVIKQEFFIPKLSKKIDNVISNCIACILSTKKQGKTECYLNPIDKTDVPLHTYHVDHLGPLASTAKNYKYLFVVIDGFSKFCWLYPVKSTTTNDVLQKLELQKEVFGNPVRIVTDKGTAFTSNIFEDYCTSNSIQHISITTGVPRGNGQVERLNRTIISVLTKMTIDDPFKWYKHVPKLQRTLNSKFHRSINRTPFEILFGIKMNNPEDLSLCELLEKVMIDQFETDRYDLRSQAKKKILEVQQENIRTFNRKRKPARQYNVGDLIAIQRTQFGTGLKLQPRFLGPYEITKVKQKDRYEVKKVGDHEGPHLTSTSADLMKPWVQDVDDQFTTDEEGSSEAEDQQDGRDVGSINFE